MTQQDSTNITLEDPGFIRLDQIVPRLIPISKATFYRQVQRGEFPRPVKISEQCTAWRKADIKALIDQLSDETLSK